MATNSSPGPTVRESIETPANRARGSSPGGGATPKARATSSSVHRIASSGAWVPRVSSHPQRLCFPPGAASAPGQALLRAVAALAQRLARHFAVVKVNRAIAEHLIGLVAFAGQEHNVAGPRLVERPFDGFLAVGLDKVPRPSFLQAHRHVVDNPQRVFAARVVAGE